MGRRPPPSIIEEKTGRGNLTWIQADDGPHPYPHVTRRPVRMQTPNAASRPPHQPSLPLLLNIQTSTDSSISSIATQKMVGMIIDSPNLSDVLSVFFDEGETEGRRQSFRRDVQDNCGSDEDEGQTADGRVAETNTFWEKQNQLLEEALDRSSSIEKRIRTDTENVLRRIQSLGAICSCSGKPMLLCRNCILRDISNHLQDIGYNSALCTSKWRRSLDILSGEHSYVDVTVDTKKGHARVIIDLSFRAEFEMARASPGYNSLVARLPEIFVGKSDKLCSVIKVVCAAAKKCMKDNKMHLGPWRKHKYMQSKWLGTSPRMPSAAPLLHAAEKVSDRQPKQRTSMLTLDLQQTAVEVV